MDFQLLIFIICVILSPTISQPMTSKAADTDIKQGTTVPKFDERFLLPKSLNKNDIIHIYGTRTRNDTWLKISLTEGIDEPDKDNVPFFIKLDYTVDDDKSFIMGSIYKGKYSKQEQDEKASNYTEEKFELVLRFEENVVHSVLNNSSLTTVFKNKLKNISFLVVEGNFDVNELKFKFE